jgi:RNA polymerase sigma-70 factor, ECF subfamily
MASPPTPVPTFGEVSEFEAIQDQTESRESDAELTARFERDAIPLMNLLYSAARRLTRGRSEAEDLVQDTMLRAFSQFRSFREGTHLKAWLMRIMHNTWINNYRKTLSRPAEQLCDEIADWQYAAWHRHSSMGDRSAEVQAIEGLPDDAIVEALESLPVNLRMVVYYADVVGYRYREIADIMATPLGTVMSRLHHARGRLRILLADVALERGLTRERAS